MLTTATSVASVFLGAGFSIGASDAFSTASFFSDYVSDCSAQNQKYNKYDNNILYIIRHISTS